MSDFWGLRVKPAMTASSAMTPGKAVDGSWSVRGKRSKLRRESFARQDELEAQRNTLINQLEAQLQQRVEERMLFTIEWEVEMTNKKTEILEQKVSLKDSCALIDKSDDIFSPLKEAITNSLDAISQRQNADETSFTPEISVSVHFRTETDLLNKTSYTLDFITIEDNGIGFTTDNLSRFKDFAKNTKGLNNRGTGKIKIFHRFDEISINSVFFESGKWNKLSVIWKLNGEYNDNGGKTKIETQKTDKTTKTETSVDRKTIVKMSRFSGDTKEQEFFTQYLRSFDELKKDVLKHFLLRLWLGNASKTLNLTIRTYLDETEKDSFSFDKNNIPVPDKKEKVSISTEKARFATDKKDKSKTQVEWVPIEPKYELMIQRFKLPVSDMDENGVYMCSKDIVVELFKFPAIKRKDANFDGFRYLTCISGDILNDPKNVSQAGDKFNFPSKKEISKKEIKEGRNLSLLPEVSYVFWDEIKDKVGHGLLIVYSDVEGLKEEREKDIAMLAKQYGILPEDAEESNIAFNDTEEEATVKLFQTQAKRFAKQSIEIHQTYEEVKGLETKKLDPTSEEYRTKFGELSNRLLEKIPQQNKDELARYVIRRDMVVELLKLALENGLDIQKDALTKKAEAKEEGKKAPRTDKEGTIHDLIFKRRMKGVPNDLWILNEEFVHFNGCSDTELDELEIDGVKLLRPNIDIDAELKAVGIDKKKALDWRPDIFLYPEEGKCVLVEVKAPDVEMSDYCDQIQKYAKIIANFSTRKFTQFYGFLIGETINPLAIPSRYKKVPYGNYWIYPSEPINDTKTGLPIADIYQEIMPLSEIAKRAEIRNRSFAEKLGITKEA